jgi:Ni,Fe-hydrogenase III small subunit/ferredoxin
MPWIPRGLREGIVTSRYPRRPDDYGEGFRGSVRVHPGTESPATIEAAVEICPTRAISDENGELRLDRGRCILCARCTTRFPEVFEFESSLEASTLTLAALVVPDRTEDDEAIERVRRDLAQKVKTLRRSVHVRHVDAGSDGSEEWEVAALTNPVYDVQRLGIYFTASPKHADLLLVTGLGSAGMRAPLAHTFEVMPEPKVVIAAGADAISGGLVGSGYASSGGIGAIVPVDVFVPGSPPSPFGLLHGILLAVGLLDPTSHKHTHSHRSAASGRGAAHGPASPEDPSVEVGS